MYGKKKSLMKLQVLISLMIVSFFIILPIACAKITYESFPENSVGVYFNYEVNEKGLIDYVGKTLGESIYIGYENADIGIFSYEITGEEEITAGGEKHDCIIATFTWKAGFTLKFEEGSTYFDDDKLTIQRDYKSKDWWKKSDQTTVKEENTNYVKMSYLKDGENVIIESDESEDVTYNKIGKDYSFPLKAGKTWSSTTETTKTTIEKQRIDNGDWEEDRNVESLTEVTEYEVISENIVEVPAGTFNCLKLRSQNQGESDYSEGYIDKNGILVKTLSYENGNLSMTIELKEYRMEIDNDDKFEILYIVPIIGVVAVILIYGFVIHKKRTTKYLETYEQLKTQEPTIKSCPTCGNKAEFVEDYNDYYCWECKKYLDIKPQKTEAKVCPKCDNEMEYVEDYEDYYCWECDAYLGEM